jgi:thiamine biosynthesis protein ThiC
MKTLTLVLILAAAIPALAQNTNAPQEGAKTAHFCSMCGP